MMMYILFGLAMYGVLMTGMFIYSRKDSKELEATLKETVSELDAIKRTLDNAKKTGRQQKEIRNETDRILDSWAKEDPISDIVDDISRS